MRTLALKRRRSERGASITFALLLFLVCAVIGSVVLTAGTAASGRLSRLSEMDRRYYCVSSAAALLRDCLDGQPATVTNTTVKKRTVSVTYDKDNVAVDTKWSKPSPDIVENPVYSPDVPGSSLLTDAAAWLMGENSNPRTRSYTLTHSAAGVAAETLKARVTQTLNPNGTMEFTVRNDNGDAESYALRLIFTLERSENTETEEQRGKPAMVQTEAGGYVITREVVTTETVTTTFLWTLTEVRKGDAA